MRGPARLGRPQRPAVLFPQLHRFLKYRIVGEAAGNFFPPWSPQSRLFLQPLFQTSDLDLQRCYSRLKPFRCHSVHSSLGCVPLQADAANGVPRRSRNPPLHLPNLVVAGFDPVRQALCPSGTGFCTGTPVKTDENQRTPRTRPKAQNRGGSRENLVRAGIFGRVETAL